MVNAISKAEYSPIQANSAVNKAENSNFANSIYSNINETNTSVEEKKNTSKLDELLEKLCAEFSKFGLKPEEIKNSGVLYRISGMNQKQIESAKDEKIRQIIDCLKAAIKDSIADGKIDLEKTGKLGNTYFIAVNTGWTIEGFKKHNNGVKKSSLLERLKETGCLKNDATLENIKPDELEKALFDFFNKTLLAPLKNAKSTKEKASIYKGQLQTFGRLLINTPDEEKAIFKQAIATLAADSRLKGLNVVLASFETTQAKQAWFDGWTGKEIKEAISSKDIEGNVPSDDDSVALVSTLFSGKGEESINETYAEMSGPAKEFFKENADKLKAIKEKEEKGIELTEEEKELVAERDVYRNLYSGVTVGTANNTKISETAKKDILGTVNKDAYNLPIYKDVLKQVNEYIEHHPEALNMPKEELVKVLDEVTNGNYTIVATNSNAKLKTPYEEKQGTVGHENKKSVEEHNQDVIQQKLTFNKIVASSEENKINQNFVVEKTTDLTKADEKKESDTKLTNFEILNLQSKAFQSASNINSYLKEANETKFGFATQVFKKFGEMGSTTQDWAMEYFSNASSTVQQLFVNKITTSYEGIVAAAKEVDLSKFNLFGISTAAKDEVGRIQDEKQRLMA